MDGGGDVVGLDGFVADEDSDEEGDGGDHGDCTLTHLCCLSGKTGFGCGP
jgi:hypothetical protein